MTPHYTTMVNIIKVIDLKVEHRLLYSELHVAKQQSRHCVCLHEYTSGYDRTAVQTMTLQGYWPGYTDTLLCAEGTIYI